jgi:hypothetical protein
MPELSKRSVLSSDGGITSVEEDLTIAMERARLESNAEKALMGLSPRVRQAALLVTGYPCYPGMKHQEVAAIFGTTREYATGLMTVVRRNLRPSKVGQLPSPLDTLQQVKIPQKDLDNIVIKAAVDCLVSHEMYDVLRPLAIRYQK